MATAMCSPLRVMLVRAVGLCSLALCSLGLGSCTTFGTAVAEFDSVSGLDETQEWPDEIAYRHDPKRYPWLVRKLDGIGSGWLFREVFAVEPVLTDLDNPSGLARECIEVISLTETNDLNTCAVASRRLLWVAELDGEQPLNQAVAVGGIEQVIFALGFDPLAMQLPDPERMTRQKVDAWVAMLETGWPGTRDGVPLSEEESTRYIEALEELTRLPLVSGPRQRALIGALDKGLLLETDPKLVQTTRRALRRALYHGLTMGLRRALSADSPRVRETAIRALHRLGGNDSMAYILGLIAKPSSAASRGLNRYDEDRFVRLALVGMCGQLNRERAMATSGNGPAPVEFLYETFFGDPDEGLRTVALEALARCLERPVDFDPDWAERWWTDDYVPNRRSVQGS